MVLHGNQSKFASRDSEILFFDSTSMRGDSTIAASNALSEPANAPLYHDVIW